MSRYNFKWIIQEDAKLSSRIGAIMTDDESDEDESPVQPMVSRSHDDELVYSDDEEEEEPEHPLGFSSSRYGLDVEKETLAHYKYRHGFVNPFTSTEADLKRGLKLEEYLATRRNDASNYSGALASFAINADTAPTVALLALGQQQRDTASLTSSRLLREQREEEQMDKLTQLFQAASIVNAGTMESFARAAPYQKLRYYENVAVEQQRIEHEIEAERKRMKRDHLEAAKALHSLLKRNEQRAESILADQERAEADFQAQENERLRQEGRKAEEDARIRAEEEKNRQQKAALLAVERKKDEDAKEELRQREKEKEKAASRALEYVTRAKSLIGKLVQVRASVEPFEKSKAVSKRRLGMKKIVNGRVNTLADDVNKIREVSADVARAIAQARAEDEELKKRGCTSEEVRGKRYLVDLLASKVIVRVQAEGFKGQRGDGFPLANMLALVSKEAKDIELIMEGHIYTVCPTAIPVLPSPSSDATEDEVMASLGMLKGKDGEFESFERFLSRTEGIISLVGNIFTSMPETHTLLSGHNGAIVWLDRFLKLLPAAPKKPLPLITAPVLDAFLTATGHMLANKHGDEFRKHLTFVENDIMARLDDSSPGKPSSIRLKKTLEGGFDGFVQKLPERALSELYFGANGGQSYPAGGQSRPVPNPFGGGGSGQSAATPHFGGQSAVPPPNPFGGGGQSAAASPFGEKSAVPPPNPFGGGGQSAAASPFGEKSAVPPPSPFGGGGGQSAAASPFGGQSAVPPPNPFGGGGDQSTAAPSPFGGGTQSAPGPNPFGGGGQVVLAPPFGGTGSSPFGGAISSAFSSVGGQSTAAPSPFGGGGQSAAAPSPFSGGQAAAVPSPFGDAPVAMASPFGGGQGATSSSPFGGVGQSRPNPSPFGSGTQSMSSPSPFGGGQQANLSPFGGGQSVAASSPFGQGNTSVPSPFGGTQASFGMNGNPQHNPNKSRKEPCRFFARGKCSYGNNCRFSHESQQGGANTGFGGPRR